MNQLEARAATRTSRVTTGGLLALWCTTVLLGGLYAAPAVGRWLRPASARGVEPQGRQARLAAPPLPSPFPASASVSPPGGAPPIPGGGAAGVSVPATADPAVPQGQLGAGSTPAAAASAPNPLRGGIVPGDRPGPNATLGPTEQWISPLEQLKMRGQAPPSAVIAPPIGAPGVGMPGDPGAKAASRTDPDRGLPGRSLAGRQEERAEPAGNTPRDRASFRDVLTPDPSPLDSRRGAGVGSADPASTGAGAERVLGPGAREGSRGVRSVPARGEAPEGLPSPAGSAARGLAAPRPAGKLSTGGGADALPAGPDPAATGPRPRTRPGAGPDPGGPASAQPARDNPPTVPARLGPVEGGVTADETGLFRVQVGSARDRREAERLQQQIRRETGLKTQLIPTAEGFRVQAGAFRNRENAVKVLDKLRGSGSEPGDVPDDRSRSR